MSKLQGTDIDQHHHSLELRSISPWRAKTLFSNPAHLKQHFFWTDLVEVELMGIVRLLDALDLLRFPPLDASLDVQLGDQGQGSQ
jgi:hypothetical protein